MITPERLAMYKKLSINSVAQRAKNLAAPGITMVAISPHDLLDLIFSFEALVVEASNAQSE